MLSHTEPSSRVDPRPFAPPPHVGASEGGGESAAAVSAEADAVTATTMRVRKRNGSFEPVDVNKIVRAVGRSCRGLSGVDSLRVATKTISGLYDGATTRELDQLSIRTAAAHIVEEPQYSRLAARLLATYIDKEVRNQEIHSFSQSIAAGQRHGLINDRLARFVTDHARKLNDAVEPARSDLFEYFGIRTLYDRYLLKSPRGRDVIETPQQFFMRVACALADSVSAALELYGLFSSLEYLPSSPTLFNAGTIHEQLSSCFLLDSPEDHLESIYRRYADIALLSKFSGGIGVAYHRVRSRGSLIQATNGHSNGIIPWLKTLDSSVSAVNQGGKRKGACCVYLEPWHADVEEFLDLRENTGDQASRTHNLNLANWIPDLFMRRVEKDENWSLFDPKTVPRLPDLWGAAFDEAYQAAEREGLAVRSMPARDLYGRMMRTLAQTGNGWMTFKDPSNARCNQTAKPGNVVHLSNLCTEILEATSNAETAVCNLGSINLFRYLEIGLTAPVAELTAGTGGDTTAKPAATVGRFDFAKLARNVRLAVRQLDRVIDLNYYPIEAAASGNRRWRPVGLGVMGLQDLFFALRLPFDAPEARQLSARIQEEIYLAALEASAELAEELGAHPAFGETRAAEGMLQPDLWEVSPAQSTRYEAVKQRIARVGLRNSLLIAIAPTATIASIAGCYECIEPQISNLWKRETLSGDFLQVNRFLVDDLKALGLWTDGSRAALKQANGSVQRLPGLPDELKVLYRTVWELPMRALLDMAADRGPFIDQSQSLNLFVESPSIGALSAMYFYAWKKGLKTTYYLRSRPATEIAKTATATGTAPVSTAAAAAMPAAAVAAPAAVGADTAAISCSLENPESCEACQ